MAKATLVGTALTTGPTMVLPAGTASGDLLVALFTNSNPTLTGWTKQAATVPSIYNSYSYLAVQTRVADGSAADTPALTTAALVTAWRDAESVGEWSLTDVSTPATNTDLPLPRVNVTGPRSDYVFQGRMGGDVGALSMAVGAGLTERYDSSNFYVATESLAAGFAGLTAQRYAQFQGVAGNTYNYFAGYAVHGINSAPSTPGAFTSPTASTVVDTTATITFGAATDADGDSLTYRTELYTPAAGWHVIRDWAAGTSFDYNFVNEQATTSAKLRVTARDTSNATSPVRESATFTIQHNVAPTAPTPTFPTGGQVLDRALSHQFTATFNDPNAGDYPTEHSVRYRVRDSGDAWTVVTAQNTDKFHIFTANFFAAAKYEYQWQYEDSLGEPSPWSTSEFFEIANAPAAPVIQHPINNGQQATQDGYIAWAASDQDGFRTRKRSADGLTQYYLHEDLNKPLVRDHPLTFPVNNRQELLEVQIIKNALWSSWSSILTNVDYTEPAVVTPIPSPDPEEAGIWVTYAAPAPVGTEPTVDTITIRVRKVGETDYKTKAVLPGNSGSWLHRDPDPFVEYEYQIYAHADNNTSSTSEWVA